MRERIVAETVDLELVHQEKLLAALAEFSANVKGDNRTNYEQRLQVRCERGVRGGQCTKLTTVVYLSRAHSES